MTPATRAPLGSVPFILLRCYGKGVCDTVPRDVSGEALYLAREYVRTIDGIERGNIADDSLRSRLHDQLADELKRCGVVLSDRYAVTDWAYRAHQWMRE